MYMRIVLSALIMLLITSGVLAADKVTINFKDTDIREVAEMVSKVTGTNFLIDPRVKGKVTVISSEPIDGDALYSTFLSILKTHGFIAIDDGTLVNILPSSVSRENAVYSEAVDRAVVNHEVEVQVIPIEHVPAVQMVPILRPLVEKEGHLAAHANSNSLIVAASRRTIAKIRNMLETLDRAAEAEIEKVKLNYADATEVVKTLQTLVQQTGAGAGTADAAASKLVADTRTNSVLISGNKGFREKIGRIARSLDTRVKDRRNIHVIRLKFANAVDIAPIIEALATEQAGSPAAAPVEGGTAEKSLTLVQPDEQTNSLIIMARQDRFEDLRSVISRLDVRRAQVLVEAIIAELRQDKEADFGIQWLAINNALIPTDADTSRDEALGNIAASFAGIGPGTAVGLISESSYSFLALGKALDNDTDANVISTPSLLTLDNEEAEISVGQEVPFETGSYTGVGGSTLPTNPFTTIERKNVGLTLRITPQISQGNAVKLNIEQEISRVDPQAADNIGAVDIVTNQRSISTNVIVDDGSILVLGGLIDDAVTETEQRVPFLGDIPLLGEAFKASTNSKIKRNLMLFIRPTIMRNAAMNIAASSKRYNELRTGQLEKYQDGVNWIPEADQPVLNPIDASGRELPQNTPRDDAGLAKPKVVNDLWFH
jgi:general secretion pathway protein D